MVGIPMVDRPLPPKLKEWMDNTKFHIERISCVEQAEARTELVSRMFNKGFKYMFFVDSDMTPEQCDLDSVINLFYKYDNDVTSCLTSSRGPRHQLLLFKKHPNITYPSLDELLYKENEVIEVYAIGFGGCLIKAEVFERIGCPWFKTDWEYLVPETKEYRSIGGKGMGADFYLSLRCQEEGIKIHLDCGTILHHMELNKETSYFKHTYPDEYKIRHVKEAIKRTNR